MDEWDELFAKASGSQDVPPQETTQEFEKKKSRKRKHGKGVGAYEVFLESRWEIATKWPMSSHCFELKGSFDSKCSAFQVEDRFRCLGCTLPAYEHTLSLSNNGGKMWWMEILCDLWNVRNASKSAALRLVSKSDIDWAKYDAIFRGSQHTLKATMARNNELEPLTSYMDELLSHLEILLLRKSSTMTPYNSFSGAVKRIILCDKVYYQLYYLHLTKHIPFTEHHAMPHPTEYFAASCIEFQALCHVEMPDHTGELNILGWDPKLFEGISAFHPLLALHWFRRMEGASIFRKTLPGGSCNSGITLWKKPLGLSSQGSKPVDDDYDSKLAKHETLAPMLLKQWRDSCRDFVCHLYAYATLNLSSLQKIRSFLQEMKCTGITEIGAGTGYVARWLERNGIKVRAYDIAPTVLKGNRQLINEYHGHTPSFERVDVCETGGSRTVAFSTDQALLLCYPPPDSSMAYDTLRNFLAKDGRAVIHIGEWKGLTGTPKFEKLLLEKMKLVDRLACSTWGTDASEISFWERTNKSSSLLIPCSACSKNEATKRCRLLRSLNYCSGDCCRAHQPTREFLFSLMMIDSDSVKIEFGDDSIFQPLVQSPFDASTTSYKQHS